MLFPSPAEGFSVDRTVATDPLLLDQDLTITLTRMRTENQHLASPQDSQLPTQTNLGRWTGGIGGPRRSMKERL
jgi:hypothetical protein